MTIYHWPPVGLTGWLLTRVDPVSRSASSLTGRDYASQAQPMRRLVTAHVTAIGPDAAGAGYMEMLKSFLAGIHWVQVDAESSIWHIARSQFRNSIMEWTAGGIDLLWSDGPDNLFWVDHAIHGTTGTADGWPVLTVTGLPPNQIVVRPHELVSVMIGVETHAARAVRVTWSDGAGTAVIRLASALPAGSGLASLGARERLILRPLNDPRPVQPVGGDWTYEWDFIEVLADEIPPGTTTVDPWS